MFWFGKKHSRCIGGGSLALNTEFLDYLPRLKDGKLSIWLSIALSLNHDGIARTGYTQIKNNTGFSVIQIKRAIKQLELGSNRPLMRLGYQEKGRKDTYKLTFALCPDNCQLMASTNSRPFKKKSTFMLIEYGFRKHLKDFHEQPAQLSILLALSLLSARTPFANNGCTTSTTELVRLTGYHRNTIQTSIDALCNSNIIDGLPLVVRSKTEHWNYVYFPWPSITQIARCDFRQLVIHEKPTAQIVHLTSRARG